MTPKQASILGALWEKDRVTQKELARQAYIDPAHLTRILDKLEERGFIERLRNPKDYRSYIIQLTKKGWESKEPINTLVNAQLQEAFGGVSQEDLDFFVRILHKIIDNLSHVTDRGAVKANL